MEINFGNPNFIYPAGFALQTVYNSTTTLIAQNTTMQGNFTSAPVKTDGTQILSATITPFSAANTLMVQAIAPMSSSAGQFLIMALYQDATNTALAATMVFGAAGAVNSGSLVYGLTANTTGPTTFKLNVMNITAAVSTWAVNGGANQAAAPIQFLGGALRTVLVIQETKV